MVDLFINIIDFFSFFIHLNIFLFLSPNFFLILIYETANCEVDLPKDTFKESTVNINDHEVHEHEEKDDKAIQLFILIAIVINYFCPCSFSQKLHHNKLRMNKGVEIREL